MVFIFAIFSGFMVKGVTRGALSFSGVAINDQPYLISAFACAGWAIVLWIAALLL